MEAIRYVDLVIPEESWNQKRTDMHEYHVDMFVMGDDWKGKFDFLKEEGVEVVYLPRTPEISSSQIKKDLYDANAVDGESKTNHDAINTDPDKKKKRPIWVAVKCPQKVGQKNSYYATERACCL